MTSPQPDLEQIITNWWGGTYQAPWLQGTVQAASNLVFGTNPPFTANDFFLLNPVFAGPASVVTGTLTAGSAIVTAILSVPGLGPGQLVSHPSIPDGTTIVSVNADNSMTLTAAATASGQTQITVWTAPVVPLVVVNTYIAMASSMLNEARWNGQWYVAMSLCVAHFCTLYVQSQGTPGAPPGQAASSGLARGMLVSKQADGLAAGYENIMGENFGSWGAWNLTTYGQELITMANIVGWGSMYIW